MAEPLVMVPGMMCDARAFWPQVAALSGRRAVQVAAFPEAETISEMAQEVIAAAPERFALMGHSMGGIVAMEVLRRAPERVSRVALISTSPLAETPAQAAWREPMLAKARAGNLSAALDAALAPENLAPGPSRAEVLKTLGEMGADLGAETFIRQSRALQKRRDAQRVLMKAEIPALILCGVHDRMTPVKRHEAMAELMKDAELVVLDEAGHMPMLEAPEAVNAALKAWLDEPMRG